VGFIVTVLGVGRILDGQELAILPLIVLALLFTIWLASLIAPEVKVTVNEAKADGFFAIIKKPEVLAFFAVYVLLQFAHAAYYVFYSIYLQQHNYTASLTGLLWALGVVAEIVLFIFMARLLKRFSLRVILLLSIGLSVMRWLMIAWGANYFEILLFAQLLHAATFGASHAAAIHLVHKYFGHRHQGKGQALYSSLSFGLGGMAGSLLSGYYWELLGAQFVYSMAAFCCVVAFVIAYIWVGRENVKLVTR
jgi:PPP family 3-phenylpropionic acid transporter